MEIIWGFIVGFVITRLGLKLIRGYLQAKNEVLRQELDQLQKSIKEKFINVNIEKHGDMFYLFEKETDRFIAQGTNMHELKLHCDSRFKTSTVVADNKDLEAFGLK